MKNLFLLLFSLTYFLGISQTKLESLVFDEINQYRVENGLSKVTWDNCPYKAAKNQTNYIDKTGDYAHTQKNSTFENPSKRLMYYGCGDGYAENILIHGYLSNLSEKDLAKQIVELWKKSDLHNKNLLMSSDWVSMGAISISDKSACLILQP